MATKTRPVRNRKDFISVYKLWSALTPIGTISETSKVSDRTITNWVNMFKTAPEEEREKDRPFHFMRLRKFDFDWNESESILRVAREHKALINREYRGRRNYTFSFRQVLWANRLSFVKPRNTPRSFVELIDKVVDHEIEELHGQPTTLTDEQLSEEVEKQLQEHAPR